MMSGITGLYMATLMIVKTFKGGLQIDKVAS